MFGKFFASTFTGSMFGAGCEVFAVWGYVIANTVDSQIELNPKMLAAALGASEDKIIAAIHYLCQPDPNSRSKVEDGRRLIKEGQFAYRVPNYLTYRSIANEDERRQYNRVKKQEQRERDAKKSKDVKAQVKDSQPPSAMSAQAEAEAEAEAEEEEKKEHKNSAHVPDDSDISVATICKAHPKLRKPVETERAVVEQLERLADQRGVENALAYLLQQTRKYALAYAKWSPERQNFSPESPRWFRSACFDEPEESWQEKEIKGNGHKSKAQHTLDTNLENLRRSIADRPAAGEDG